MSHTASHSPRSSSYRCRSLRLIAALGQPQQMSPFLTTTQSSVALQLWSYSVTSTTVVPPPVPSPQATAQARAVGHQRESRISATLSAERDPLDARPAQLLDHADHGGVLDGAVVDD